MDDIFRGDTLLFFMNIPNLLTVLRLAALPVIAWLFRSGYYSMASGVFVVTMLTDCVDGWIARRLNQRSALGMYLDPVVDKIVVLALLYELSYGGVIDIAVAHLLLARELLQNGVRAVASGRGTVVGANWMGKTKMVLQSILIGMGLLLPLITGEAGPLGRALGAGVHVLAWSVLALAWMFFGVFVYWNRAVLVEGSPTLKT